MIKNLIFIVSIILFSNASYSEEKSVGDKIKELNRESIKTLGISLKELGYLSQAVGGNFMPLWAAERTGEIEIMRSLEKAGYASLTISQGLPDGQNKEITYVNVTPTYKGQLICDSI